MTNSENNSFDILIIGAGPGGYVSAIKATQYNKKVAVVEKDELGGICLNWGCIPTKALLRSAEVFNLIKNSGEFGINVGNYSIDFNKIIKRSREVSGRLVKGVQFLMNKNSINVFKGSATLVDKNTVKIKMNNSSEEKIVKSNYIIIATGARPREFPGMKIDRERILSSKETLILDKKPESIIIIGAGAVGVEFAYFFNSMGTKVTLIEMMKNILPVEDEEVSVELEKSFKKQGIKVLTNSKVEKIERREDKVIVLINKDNKEETIEGEYAVVAVGVQGNYENLGLEKLGIEVEKSWIKVNKFYQTNVDNIYAIGDIIGPPWLAHVASHEGILAVEHIVGEKVEPLDYKNVPGCTYCNPQVASIGYTEKSAKEAGFKIKTGKFPMRANGKSLALGETDGFVKIIIDEEYGEILGCHIIGPDATELITEIGVAKTLESTYLEILKTIHPHPTISEAIFEATLNSYNKSIHI